MAGARLPITVAAAQRRSDHDGRGAVRCGDVQCRQPTALGWSAALPFRTHSATRAMVKAIGHAQEPTVLADGLALARRIDPQWSGPDGPTVRPCSGRAVQRAHPFWTTRPPRRESRLHRNAMRCDAMRCNAMLSTAHLSSAYHCGRARASVGNHGGFGE
jgi:hypothetical protein